MAKYSMAVMTNAKPGMDDEYSRWYTDLHIGQVLDIPGFTSAQFFKAVPTGQYVPRYRYYAMFEVDTDDPVALATEMFGRHGTPALEACDAMDPDTCFGIYDAVTPVVTR